MKMNLKRKKRFRIEQMDDISVSIQNDRCCKDCEALFKSFWGKLKREIKKDLPPLFYIEVVLIDSETMRRLNSTYRGKDNVTDVLSFEDGDILPDGRLFLGSVLICCERAKEQAKEIGNSPEQELLFLFLHGTLHLLGFDHETDNGEMMALQSDLKKRLGIFQETLEE